MSSSKAKYSDEQFIQALRKAEGKVRASKVREKVGCDRSTAWRRLEKLAVDDDTPIAREVVIENRLHRYYYKENVGEDTDD